MYINKANALLQAQQVQFTLAMMGYQTSICTGTEGALHKVEITCFYKEDKDEQIIERTIISLMHDGDTYEKKSSRGARWIDYTTEY